MAIFDVSGNPLTYAHDKSGEYLDYAYDLNGNTVYSRKPPTVDYDDWTLFPANWCKITMYYMQGFEVYGNTIFQFRHLPESTMTTIDKESNTIITQDIQTGTKHGNGVQFSNEFYEESDEFPLLYAPVTSSTNETNVNVLVNRVTKSTSETVRTYRVARASAGYSAGICLDNENRIMYLVGYTQNEWYDEQSGNNKVVISKWDLNDVSDEGNNVYSPTLLDRYERDFIYCMQGTQYHDGMLWVASGSGSGAAGLTQYIYALDPATGEILHAIDFGIMTEIEGVTFISDTELIFNLQGGTYRKIIFAVH